MARDLSRPGKYEWLWCENMKCKEYRKPSHYHEKDEKVCSVCGEKVVRALWICPRCRNKQKDYKGTCPNCGKSNPYWKQKEHRMRSFGCW